MSIVSYSLSALGTYTSYQRLSPRFVATQQQNSAAARVKRIQDSVGATLMLNAKFAHVRVFRWFNTAGVREAKVRLLRFQKPHGGSDGLLFGLRQTSPPIAQFTGIFNFPQGLNRPRTPYFWHCLLLHPITRCDLIQRGA